MLGTQETVNLTLSWASPRAHPFIEKTTEKPDVLRDFPCLDNFVVTNGIGFLAWGDFWEYKVFCTISEYTKRQCLWKHNQSLG